MIDTNKREEIRRQKDKVRRRIRVEVDPDNYQYIPAKKQVDFYDEETLHNVAVYVRVSTDDIRQTTSYELQKNTMRILSCVTPTGRLCGSMPTRASAGHP